MLTGSLNVAVIGVKWLFLLHLHLMPSASILRKDTEKRCHRVFPLYLIYWGICSFLAAVLTNYACTAYWKSLWSYLASVLRCKFVHTEEDGGCYFLFFCPFYSSFLRHCWGSLNSSVVYVRVFIVLMLLAAWCQPFLQLQASLLPEQNQIFLFLFLIFSPRMHWIKWTSMLHAQQH